MLFAGFDTETTGLKAGDDRIIELALLIYDSDSRKCVDKLIQRYDPEHPIHPEAQAVHGISYGDLVGCPKFRHCAADVAAKFGEVDLVVAHNLKFDATFLAAELSAAGVPLLNVQSYDTLECRWATPNGKVPSLAELCFACGVKYDPALAHAAEYDVEVMMQSFFNALDWGFVTLPAITPKHSINIERKEAA